MIIPVGSSLFVVCQFANTGVVITLLWEHRAMPFRRKLRTG